MNPKQRDASDSVTSSNTGSTRPAPHTPAARHALDLSNIPPAPPPPTPGIGLPETRAGNQSQLRRKTDEDVDAELALFQRKERIGKVALIALAIVLFGLVLGAWHWQAGVIFVGLAALVCASESRDEKQGEKQ